MGTDVINLAVITGAKSHDVIGFHELFRSLDGINSYIQHIDDFASSAEEVRDFYDVILFYFMMPDGPTDEGLPGYCGQPKTVLEHLKQTGQGIVVLHHALLAYPSWPVWDDIVGIENRELSTYRHDEILEIEVEDPAHPITRGLSNWTITDETYLMPDAGAGNQILLTVSHENSMKTVAWTRLYQQSKVFCLQLGHDNQAWVDHNFREVLKRGIEWSSRNKETS
jgi:hypothetical protein